MRFLTYILYNLLPIFLLMLLCCNSGRSSNLISELDNDSKRLSNNGVNLSNKTISHNIEVGMQLGHANGVLSVAFSSDGRLLLTGGGDKIARLWDVATGKELRQFIGHSGPVKSVAFSLNGRYILTGGAYPDNSARLWDAATGRELRMFSGHYGPVNSVVFSRNGQFVLTGSDDKTARLWKADSGDELRQFNGHSWMITSVAFSPDNRFILTGGADKTARLWDSATGNELYQFKGEFKAHVTSIAFSPKGDFVLIGSDDMTARLWDIETGKEQYQLKVSGPFYKDSVEAVAFSPDGHFVLTCGGKTAHLWDAISGRELKSYHVQLDSYFKSAAFSPDSRFIVTGGRETTILWDVASGKEIKQFKGGSSPVKCAVVSNNGRFLVTGSDDQIGHLWDLSTGKEKQQFKGHTWSITSVAISPDNQFVLTGSGFIDWNVRLWDTITGKELRQFVSQGGWVSPVSFSPQGSYALMGYSIGIVGFTDFITGKILHKLKGHYNHDIHSVAFSSDGRLALTGAENTRLWDLTTGFELRQFNAQPSYVQSAIFSPDGKYVLTASDFPTSFICLWNKATGKELRKFNACDKDGCFNPGVIYSVAFSPDGSFLASGSRSVALIWDTAAGTVLRKLVGHSGSVRSVAFSPDGRFVLTGSDDTTVRLWSASTGKELRQFIGHFDGINSVAFSPDGQFVLTGSNDKTARLWKTDSGEELRRFTIGPFGLIKTAIFSHNGRYIFTGGNGPYHIASLWDADTGRELHQFYGKTNVQSSAFSQDDVFIITGSFSNTIDIWNVSTGKEERQFNGHSGVGGVNSVAVSPDGNFILTGGQDKTRLWDAVSGKELMKYEGGTAGNVESVTFSPDNRLVLAGGSEGARLWDVKTGVELRQYGGNSNHEKSVAFSNNGQFVLTSNENNPCLWDSNSGKKLHQLEGHSGAVNSVKFFPDDRYVLTSSEDSSTRIWNRITGEEIVRLFSLRDGLWIVLTPDGRFDTNNLEQYSYFQWIVKDEPFTPLSPEIFMRDYYEPKLLPRVLAGEKFKPVRPLADLNRVQPGVNILKIEKGTSPNLVSVTVEANGAERPFKRNGKDVVMKTGVYDLRLYRDGQLVTQWPEPKEETYKSIDITSIEELNTWRKATEVSLGKDGKFTKTFTVRLPRREDLKEVEFSAYAFNVDRVKSETARKKYPLPEQLKPVKGRAYVITVGVSQNEDMQWSLDAAAGDAKLLHKAISDNITKLVGSRGIEKVVHIPLITVHPANDYDDAETTRESKTFITPTKENIRTVIDLLAGRKVDPSRLEAFPSELIKELRPIQPEDMVILSFSSHGVTDSNGEFYVLPYDLGTDGDGKITPNLLKHSIASQELSYWLSPFDAEQMYMIIDACHSAAAVDVEGFKPGPMGNPGLGQLSYDKKMPILTATQAKDSAWAQEYSLLTYALAREGIEENKAAKDGKLTLADALRYAEARVPELYAKNIGKEGKAQMPKLFEFKR